MEKFVMDLLNYFTPAKVIGAVFALGTLAYLFHLTIKHRSEFWEAFKGENKKLDIIEAVIIVWLTLFTAMIIGDFTLGLVASEEAWYSMDAVFLFAVGGKTIDLRQRGVNPPK